MGKNQCQYYSFQTKSTPSISEVGGKAKALIETTNADFNVPKGFVLCASFFKPWLAKVQSSSEWKMFALRQMSSTCLLDGGEDLVGDRETKELKKHCDNIKAFGRKNLVFTEEQRAALEEALAETFGGEDDCNSISEEAKESSSKGDGETDVRESTSISSTKLFAVRSSSPEEDTLEQSFAGGYETTLGVTRTKLQNAILHSFLSVFDERVVQYKMRHKTSAQRPSMAVIVQEQIPSHVAGVAFSLNPRNNCYDEAVVDANFGLGETVVAGQVTPDTYVVDKLTREIVEKKISTKETCLRISTQNNADMNDASVEKKQPYSLTEEICNENPNDATLTDEQLQKVIQLAANVEKHYNKPMDMEWAMVDQTLYLLQSRPITTHFPLFKEMLTRPEEEKRLYMDIIQLTQGFDQCMSVLGMSVWNEVVLAAKGDMLRSTHGKDSLMFHNHGRQYINISTWLKALGKKSFHKMMGAYNSSTSSIFENLDLQKEYLPQKPCAETRAVRTKFFLSLLRRIPSLFRGYFFPHRALKLYKCKAEEVMQVSKTISLADEGKGEGERKETFSDAVRAAMGPFRDLCMVANFIVAPLIARYRLSRMFARVKEQQEQQEQQEGAGGGKEESGHNIDELLIALQMNLPGNPTSRMGHAMNKLASYDEIQLTKTGDEFEEKIQTQSYSAEVMACYKDYMDQFGCRCIREIDIATPRPYENLPKFFEQLQQIDLQHNATNTVQQRSDEAYEKLLTIAKKIGKERQFKRLAKLQHDLWGYREHPKYLIVVLTDALRSRALSIGQRMKKEGRIDLESDIFHLNAEQISLCEHYPQMAVRPMIENNLQPRRFMERVKEWPTVLDSRGKIFRPVRKQVEGGMGCDAIAPGIVRGVANVLRDPYEKPLKKGEILVTRASDPGWTPIFINAAAVVLEVGGPLQHGAIIAREYGLPCVSGLEGATDVIKDGQMIEVDGTNGIVRLIDQ